MKEDELLDPRIELYMDAFDYYLKTGRRHPKITKDDIVWPYIKNVIDSMPMLNDCEMVVLDIVRDEVIQFLVAVLGAFILSETDQQKIVELLNKYENSSVEEKRELWYKVYATIKDKYGKEEVNIDGYAEQFDGEYKQSIDDALTADWRDAIDRDLERKKVKIVEDANNKLQESIKFYGTNDYETRVKLNYVYCKYPDLQDIVRHLGREKTIDDPEKENTTIDRTSTLTTRHTSHVDIEIIEPSRDLASMIPAEKAIMADPEAEMLFYYRFAHSQLQTFANRPFIEDRKRQNTDSATEQRMAEGPIIVALDTSASMSANPKVIAQSLLMQILQLARSKKRKCYLLTFSVRVKTLDVTPSTRWRDIEQFLRIQFTGGTNGEIMLKSSINLLKQKDFAMADILIISDFYFKPPVHKTLLSMNEQRDKGTRFYGLQIGTQNCKYEQYLDRLWKVTKIANLCT